MAAYEYHGHGEGDSHFYRKQFDETVSLVPGNQKFLDVVRRIMKMIVVEGKGYFSIAKMMNIEGIQSPKGGKWDKSSIKRVATCPVYTGRMIFNRVSEADFFRRGKDGPVAADQTAAQSNVRTKFRPESDWVTVDCPATIDILDPELRQLVIAYQDSVIRKDSVNKGRGLQKDKHSKSSFILKDLLRLKQDGTLMRGSIANQLKYNDKVYRYYRARGYHNVTRLGTANVKLVPAEPLEALALDILNKVFAAAPDLKPRLLQFIIEQQSARHELKTKLVQMQKQRDNLAKKILCFADLNDDFDDALIQKVADMRARIRDLDLRIAVGKEQSPDGNVETNSGVGIGWDASDEASDGCRFSDDSAEDVDVIGEQDGD